MMMMATNKGEHDDDNNDVSWLAKWGAVLSFTIALMVQGIFFTVWLTKMRSDVDIALAQKSEVPAYAQQIKSDLDHLKERQVEMITRLNEFDRVGTRATQLLDQRIGQVMTDLNTVDAHCIELGRRIEAVAQTTLENKVRLDHEEKRKQR